MKKIKLQQTISCCESQPIKQHATIQQPSNKSNNLPIAIIGAGPIGLAAAAHLIERGENFIIFESGSQAGHNISTWGHVRLFSPWQFNIDKAAARLLSKHGWQAPSPDVLPTGLELVEHYLLPLAELPEIKSKLLLNTKVIDISRKDTDKMKSVHRELLPFEIYTEVDGIIKSFEAKAVIDASGTWGHSNPLYANGIWTKDEQSLRQHIFYGIPNIVGNHRVRYAGKNIAVVGGGHSAINTLLELAELKETEPSMKIVWIMRKNSVEEAYGGKANDQLVARGELGSRIHQLVSSEQIQVMTPFKIQKLSYLDKKIIISGKKEEKSIEVNDIDEIIVNTGSRPDFSFLRELRLSIDQATESVETLAPLIDPNLHSCGTVRPHGEKELRHSEKDFYIVGMKSYGRAPTFLMATGYEQVRSVAAYLGGDFEAALNVELDLPETGVCRISNPSEVKNDKECCSTASASNSTCCS